MACRFFIFTSNTKWCILHGAIYHSVAINLSETLLSCSVHQQNNKSSASCTLLETCSIYLGLSGLPRAKIRFCSTNSLYLPEVPSPFPFRREALEKTIWPLSKLLYYKKVLKGMGKLNREKASSLQISKKMK